jgi:P27 family predicted phage terminase small subunit
VIRLARGNPGHRPINRDEPLPPALPAAWPEELAEDAEAQAEWVRTIVPAIDTGQITAADRVFAISHCHFWSTWRSQLADAAKHAHVVSVGKNKYPMGNPARIMANRTFLLLAKVDAELGLTPSSRPRVKGIKAPGGPHSNINRYLNVLPGGKVSSR